MADGQGQVRVIHIPWRASSLKMPKTRCSPFQLPFGVSRVPLGSWGEWLPGREGTDGEILPRHLASRPGKGIAVVPEGAAP